LHKMVWNYIIANEYATCDSIQLAYSSLQTHNLWFISLITLYILFVKVSLRSHSLLLLSKSRVHKALPILSGAQFTLATST